MVFTLKDDYEKFLELKRNHITNNEIDTCNENFLAPTTLIPLLYIAKHDKTVYFVRYAHHDEAY